MTNKTEPVVTEEPVVKEDNREPKKKNEFLINHYLIKNKEIPYK